jgi:hypothetical protein
MKAEAYCALQLRFRESEHFLAVAEERGAEKAPDLVSVRREGDRILFRIREVKFKLEDRLVRKALSQLESGVRQLGEYPSPEIDRLELVIALQGRKLKEPEKGFLGRPLSDSRYELLLDGRPCEVASRPVSVLLL